MGNHYYHFINGDIHLTIRLTFYNSKDLSSALDLIPTKDALVVAAIGDYQGEEHLLVYSFKREK